MELGSEDGRDGSIRIVKSLEITRSMFPSWPYSAKLSLDTHIAANVFHQIITLINNTGTAGFSWTGGLHPYFLVDNLLTTSLYGLEGVLYRDCYSEEAVLVAERHLVWCGQTY